MLCANLGVVYEGLNDPESARRAYQKALDKSPDYGPAKANLTRLGGEEAAPCGGAWHGGSPENFPVCPRLREPPSSRGTPWQR